MIGVEIAQTVARQRVELDGAIATDRPDALQHHGGRREIARARLLDDVAHQFERDLGSNEIELARHHADRLARPAGTAGIALGEAAVGLAENARRNSTAKANFSHFFSQISGKDGAPILLN